MPEFYTLNNINEILDTIKEEWVGKDKTSLNELEKKADSYLTFLEELQEHAVILEKELTEFEKSLGKIPGEKLEEINFSVNSYNSNTSTAFKEATVNKTKGDKQGKEQTNMYHQTIRDLLRIWVPLNLAPEAEKEVMAVLSLTKTFNIDMSVFLEPLISFYEQYLNHDEKKKMKNIIEKYKIERSNYLSKINHP